VKLYSLSMTTRMGAKGQVVIPKAVRDRAGLQPGDEVDIDLDGDTVVLTPVRRERQLAGRFVGSGMAQRLLDDRATEPR
jgi:AbrB family looped-hinge helix DNA binding protein